MEEKRDFDWKLADARARVITAMLPEVVFDGWSAKAFEHALGADGVDANMARLAFPNGAIDVAAAFHMADDRRMLEWVEDFTKGDKISNRIERALMRRFEIAALNKDAVRAASALFALPQNAARGGRLIWGTADAIWRVLGDQSAGFDYYSKRTSLSAVYSAALFYFLQDEDPTLEPTRAFVARRISDTLRFGKFTGQLKRPFQREK